MEPLSLRLLNKVVFTAKYIPTETYQIFSSLLMALGVFILSNLLALLSALGYIPIEGPLFSIIIIGSFFLAIIGRMRHTGIMYARASQWLEPSYTNGWIRFYNDHFVLTPKKKAASKVELKNIASIKLEHAMYNGYTWGTKGMILHSGACKLSLKPKDGSNTLQFRFVINDEDDLKQITAHLKHWYQLGIEIEEREPVNNDRSVLFRTDWTYEQYQELKEELGVKEFFKKGY